MYHGESHTRLRVSDVRKVDPTVWDTPRLHLVFNGSGYDSTELGRYRDVHGSLFWCAAFANFLVQTC